MRECRNPIASGFRMAVRRTTNVGGEMLGKTDIENFGSPEVCESYTADLILRWYPPPPVRPASRPSPAWRS